MFGASSFRALATALGILTCSSVFGATLSQTFESGEDTSNWGPSGWSGGAIDETFLTLSFGGTAAGGGASQTQGFDRVFRDNTVGLDVKDAYTISMYVQVDAFDGPSGGLFEIIDGAYGSNNAANLRIFTEEVEPGVYEYHWQARDASNQWLDLNIDMDLGTPYHVELSINPATFTYSATVQSVTSGGVVLQTGQVTGLSIDQNVFNNNANGDLRFYIQASAGGTSALVDNINITGVPEPSVIMLACGGFWVLSC
jgi:hypothetical protein